MAKRNLAKKNKNNEAFEETNNVFKIRKENIITQEKSEVHVLKEGQIICDTEPLGHPTPQGRSPIEIVLDASEGFIPLWTKNTILRWRFRQRSMSNFENPTAAKQKIRELFGDALLSWGDAAPVKFTEDDDLWDFEIVMKQSDECSSQGCVLASAFFPDGGRHEFVVYPKIFAQSQKEQVDTFIHEIGHIFGLRHFFAKISETQWPSEIFGTHNKFSIMNYGALSELTEDDKNDLKRLYQLVWSGMLMDINGTPIRLVKPYSTLGASTSDAMLSVGQIQTQSQPLFNAAYIRKI